MADKKLILQFNQFFIYKKYDFLLLKVVNT